MIKTLSVRLTDFFIRKAVIKEEDKANYIYSFEVMFFDFLSLLALVILALITNRFLETLIYLAAFLLLRCNTGGYHASTHLKCFLTLTFSYLAFIFLITFIPPVMHALVCTVSVLAAAAVIFLLAPIDHVNRRFTTAEYEIFKARCRILAAVLAIIFIVLACVLPVTHRVMALSGGLGMVSIALSLTAAKIIKNKKDKEELSCQKPSR